METKLSDQIETAGSRLLTLVGSFNETAFSTIPFEGSWSAAQVADHVLKSCRLILRAVQGTVEKTDRDPETHIAQIKTLFLDFNLKFQSPEMIRPSEIPPEKAQLLSELGAAIQQIKKAAETMDLSMTCVDVDMPGLGKISRIEWLSFFVFHTERHIHQLKNIAGNAA